jgi:hypothetical protein
MRPPLPLPPLRMLLLCGHTATAFAGGPENPMPRADPRADPAALVHCDATVRISVLTPKIVRIERVPTASDSFEDRVSTGPFSTRQMLGGSYSHWLLGIRHNDMRRRHLGSSTAASTLSPPSPPTTLRSGATSRSRVRHAPPLPPSPLRCHIHRQPPAITRACAWLDRQGA